MDEVAKEPTLTFVERGDRVFIDTFPGRELTNPYSMNVIDLCPVGALTNRDYRFKAKGLGNLVDRVHLSRMRPRLQHQYLGEKQ